MIFLCFVLWFGAAQVQDVRVHVTAKTEADGFVDSGRIQDSVKDLQEIISKRKGLSLALEPRDADIVLEVVASGPVVAGVKTETNVRSGIFGGINSTSTAKQETLPSITVILKVHNSDYSKELSITQQMFWKDLAKRIVDQAENWIKTNRAKLSELRDK